MIQMFRDQLPRDLPCVVAVKGDNVAIIVNSNYLGGETAPMRVFVNTALAALEMGYSVAHLVS